MPSPNSEDDGVTTVTAAANRPSLAPATRRVRRYGFACTGCKTRKVKCSGDQPECQNCRRSGDECVWPSSASNESRLRNANARIRDLEATIRRSSQHQQVSDPVAEYAEFGPAETPAQETSDTSPATTQQEPSPSVSHVPSNSASSLWFQVGIGEDGTIAYHGPTSRFHAASLNEEDATVDQRGPSPSQLDALRSQYDLMDSIWMPLITSQKFMKGTGITTEAGLIMLDIYWAWLHPLHNCVYKPTMIMDLALGGSYCSDFLLMCIFALVARHLPEEPPSLQGIGKGHELAARAKALLLDEFSAPKPSIPTIQGLLILGGRQCAVGNSSEGWLYTGMAIRMMTDIGLHLDTTRLSALERWTPAEMETRKRLYNSAYIWDKTLSLSLGRPPSLVKKPYATQDILDKFDDERPWHPVHTFEVLPSFSPSPALNSSTFCAFCRIHEITTDMMLLFSNISSHDQVAAKVSDLDARFQNWYDELPTGLKITQSADMTQSPPPHIVSLNLLYHTLRVLLRRPYLASPDLHQRDHYMNDCINHLEQIYDIHSLYARTFPHRLMTYQISYCIFIAASTEVQELKTASAGPRRDGAASRLAAAVKVLQNETSHTPGIGRSLDTIRRLLCSGQYQVVNPVSTADRNNLPKTHGGQSQLSVTQDRHDVGEHQASGQAFPRRTAPSTPQPPQFSGPAAIGDIAPFFILDNENWVSDDIGPAWTNTGGGFHPEAMSWAAADGLQRSPVFPTFNDHVWTSSNNNPGH